jgi:LmbE family N-acetylglucosaminyl deacetylase
MNVLMVVAHPDDEVLFGWPVLCSSDNSVSLLVLTDNHVKYGQGPTDAVFEVAAANDVKWSHVLRFDTNVYRLPTRNATPTLRQVTDAMCGEIMAAVSLWRPDAIFTHNPMGEYGHGDHRLAFNLVTSFNTDDRRLL